MHAQDTPDLNGAHILVVDDSDINRTIADFMIRSLNGVTTLAEQGEQAVALIQQNPDGFDAVLMDLQMPVMDGITAARRILVDLGLSDLPIVALTAADQPEEHEAAKAAGIRAFLTKPIDVAVLTRTLREVMR